MLFTRTLQTSDEMIRDKFLVEELIGFERFCRDNHFWDAMEKCYHEDSVVDISWYQGSGKGFVRESEKMDMAAPHKINNILVWINGDKAIGVCMASIMGRKDIGGCLYDLTSYVRLYYRLVKADNEWYILSFECVYEKDSLIAVEPNVSDNKLPCYEIDQYRESYANLTYVLQLNGYEINDALAGDDKPELVEEMYQRYEEWFKT